MITLFVVSLALCTLVRHARRECVEPPGCAMPLRNAEGVAAKPLCIRRRPAQNPAIFSTAAMHTPRTPGKGRSPPRRGKETNLGFGHWSGTWAVPANGRMSWNTAGAKRVRARSNELVPPIRTHPPKESKEPMLNRVFAAATCTPALCTPPWTVAPERYHKLPDVGTRAPTQSPTHSDPLMFCTQGLPSWRARPKSVVAASAPRTAAAKQERCNNDADAAGPSANGRAWQSAQIWLASSLTKRRVSRNAVSHCGSVISSAPVFPTRANQALGGQLCRRP